MYKATKEIRTETAHRLMDYSGKCAHLHGHSYIWRLTATAEELDALGMVADFSRLKDLLKAFVEPFDHATILHRADPLARAVEMNWSTSGETQRVFLVPFNPTAENLARHVLAKMRASNSGLTLESLTVWETPSCHVEAC